MGRPAPARADCPGGVGIPCDKTSIVGAVMVCPEGLLEYPVLIRDEFGNPIPDVPVQLDFAQVPPDVPYPRVGMCSEYDDLANGCPTDFPPNPYNEIEQFTGSLVCFTDDDGFARFHISGSGEFIPTALEYVTVRADDIFMKRVGMLSLDVVNLCGDPFPDGMVGLSDAVVVTIRFHYSINGVGSAYNEALADYNQDGKVTLADVRYGKDPITQNAKCNCSAPPCYSCN
jgi:hypothetical protein